MKTDQNGIEFTLILVIFMLSITIYYLLKDRRKKIIEIARLELNYYFVEKSDLKDIYSKWSKCLKIIPDYDPSGRSIDYFFSQRIKDFPSITSLIHEETGDDKKLRASVYKAVYDYVYDLKHEQIALFYITACIKQSNQIIDDVHHFSGDDIQGEEMLKEIIEKKFHSEAIRYLIENLNKYSEAEENQEISPFIKAEALKWKKFL